MKLLLLEEFGKSPNQSYGVSQEKEEEIRNEIVTFISYYGIILQLNRKTISKAILIFHRYSKQVPFRKFDRFLYAATCMFLAAKLDDSPRTLNACCKTYQYCMINRRKKNKLDFTDQATASRITPEDYDQIKTFEAKPNVMKKLREDFCFSELKILNQVGFDFDIALPYRYLEAYRKYPKLKDELVLSFAHNFLNDSYRTQVCLYYDPRIIALACLQLSQTFTKQPLEDIDGKAWYYFLSDDIDKEDIDQAGNIITALYKFFEKASTE